MADIYCLLCAVFPFRDNIKRVGIAVSASGMRAHEALHLLIFLFGGKPWALPGAVESCMCAEGLLCRILLS